jgi:hypothetical protein
MHLLVFYEGIYQNAHSNQQDGEVLLKRTRTLYYTTQRVFFYNKNIVLSE